MNLTNSIKKPNLQQCQFHNRLIDNQRQTTHSSVIMIYPAYHKILR